MSMDVIDAAVQKLADDRADQLSKLINDQLQELGGDQTLDYILLNRKVVDSGIKFGLGVLEGPFVRKVQQCGWMYNTTAGNSSRRCSTATSRSSTSPRCGTSTPT
jgi:hypothetical protein